jgi:hypothetical protein
LLGDMGEQRLSCDLALTKLLSLDRTENSGEGELH